VIRATPAPIINQRAPRDTRSRFTGGTPNHADATWAAPRNCLRSCLAHGQARPGTARIRRHHQVLGPEPGPKLVCWCRFELGLPASNGLAGQGHDGAEPKTPLVSSRASLVWCESSSSECPKPLVRPRRTVGRPSLGGCGPCNTAPANCMGGLEAGVRSPRMAGSRPRVVVESVVESREARARRSRSNHRLRRGDAGTRFRSHNHTSRRQSPCMSCKKGTDQVHPVPFARWLAQRLKACGQPSRLPKLHRSGRHSWHA